MPKSKNDLKTSSFTLHRHPYFRFPPVHAALASGKDDEHSKLRRMKKLNRVGALILSPAIIRTTSNRTLCSATISAASSTSTTTVSAEPSSFSLKNVTKSNFESTLSELRRHVKAADFISIDLEMTGITSAPCRESFEFDRYDVRYLKVKDSADKFAVVQFGVCPFRWDKEKKSFVAHPHNFYVFHRQELPGDDSSYEFLCQTTSVDFLARFQFDFNACIREGVSYLSRGQESEALNRLNSAYDNERSADSSNILKEVKDIQLVSFADILFSERMKLRFKEWRNGLLQERNGVPQLISISKDSKQQMETIFFKTRPALKLDGFTSHQLRLIQSVTRKHFTDLLFIRVHNEASVLQKLIVYTDSESDRNNLMGQVKEERRQEEEKKIQAAVGFRRVIDLLSDEKKLIVGHNCFLDFAHIYRKFFGPLPSTAEEFVAAVHQYFPHIIDTKILINANTVLQYLMKKSSTSLSSAFSQLCPEIALTKSPTLGSPPCAKVEVQVDDMRSSNWNSGAKHEAGYDAFMTGCVFAQSCCHLGIDFKSDSSPNLADNEKLQRYINLLYLSWNSGDIINLTTGITQCQTYPIIKKRFQNIVYPNIVIIWGFPSKLTVSEIKECITKAFGMSSVISIYQLDQSAVFVQLSKEELVSNFLSLKQKLETGNDPLSVLHPLTKILEGGKTCAAGYETYKEICGSSISKVLFAEQAETVGIKWKTKLVESREKVDSKRDSGTVKLGNQKTDSSKSEVDDSLYAFITQRNREMSASS